MTTAIIGGGAAGVAAAIAAAQAGDQVLVLERGAKPLKKLGVTGNGRANLLNSGALLYYGDAAFAQAVLRRIGFTELAAFFHALGVPLRQESEGRVYPAALLAQVAVDALLLRAHQLGVTFLCNTRVPALVPAGAGFTLHAWQTQDGDTPPRGKGGTRQAVVPETPLQRHADRVIVTPGGAAAPAHGTDGSGYALLTAFGHTLTPIKPALCALLTDKRRIAGLAGQRVRARLRLTDAGGQALHAAEGEVLFGEDAVSGIATMQLARFTEDGALLYLDFRPAAGWDSPDGIASEAQHPAAPGASLPGVRDARVLAELRRLAAMRQDLPVRELLTGVFSVPVARFLLRESGLADASAPIRSLTEASILRLCDTLCAACLPVLGTRGFPQAQVTAGGIATRDVNPATMESRLCPGLYAAGEVLDVDGDCGGFNLMFAFASGLLAGRAGRGR